MSALSTPATAMHPAARVARLRVIVASFRHALGDEGLDFLYGCGLRANPPIRINSEGATMSGERI